MVRFCASTLWLLGLSFFSVQLLAAPASHYSVGYHRLTFADPLDGQAMQAYAFYPTQARVHAGLVDGYDIAAGEDSPIALGRFPVLMLSHGNNGTPLALHDLITAIARQGFVVVAVLHPGDNYLDQSRLGTLSNLYGRPLQISAAITAVLAEPMLSPFVNVGQVGVIGYSAGGETALILSGAQPDLQRLRDYCAQYPSDQDACKAHGELVADRDDLAPQADPRVRALLLMAPLSLMFGRHTLEDVNVPTLIYAGDHDQLVAYDKNAGALARKLPRHPQYRLLAGAGHFVFLAPCSAEQAARAPALCADGEGVDRVSIHKSLVSEAGTFFSQALGTASRAGLQTADQ
ncbi:alpha/beta hydrolase family protein [Pseudomonas typographi]|uniref:alpha/beta hydrolase family protein n=1 Tax=Pseudomonas typographi TaxID=2715964 RepID=UPI001683FDDA|nr:alpha/beta fold hydrolase [Pseudomonas typographi]MBD1554838.1 alpha/beta fold hydrolase [Pseudomonas typographi]MBD1589887.1 alpha/beta fold hydrolase [Pseudomonas typographi]